MNILSTARKVAQGAEVLGIIAKHLAEVVQEISNVLPEAEKKTPIEAIQEVKEDEQ